MNARVPYRLSVVIGSLLRFICSTSAHTTELTATWTGADDGVNYSDADNWDIEVVPCNVGTLTFEVDIPEGFSVNAMCRHAK